MHSITESANAVEWQAALQDQLELHGFGDRSLSVFEYHEPHLMHLIALNWPKSSRVLLLVSSVDRSARLFSNCGVRMIVGAKASIPQPNQMLSNRTHHWISIFLLYFYSLQFLLFGHTRDLALRSIIHQSRLKTSLEKLS